MDMAPWPRKGEGAGTTPGQGVREGGR